MGKGEGLYGRVVCPRVRGLIFRSVLEKSYGFGSLATPRSEVVEEAGGQNPLTPFRNVSPL